MTISNFVAYVKQAWKNKPDTSTPLSAARLTHLEDGIKGNSDAIEKIAAAVVSQIVNDPNKIASMASLYSVNQAVTQLNSDLDVLAIKQRWLSMGSGITELYGDSSYHPYAILLTDNFVYISGNFVVPADITATTTILSNLVSPVKMRWVPIYNMTTRTMYYAYIATGGSNLTIDNLPKGNYSINFGYQHAYGVGI